MLHAVSRETPQDTASRATQSRPKRNRSAASRSSVQRQKRFGLAPYRVIAPIASGRLFQGEPGGPPRRKTQMPASTKSLAMSRSIASCVSVTPLAA